MTIPYRYLGCRLTCLGCTLTAAFILTAFLSSGCSQCDQSAIERGYADQSKTQIHFISPPGAKVTVAGGPTRTHQVATYGPFNNRLEQEPEEHAVFNLAPGRYEFKYSAIEGLPGVKIYGELEVKHANSKAARIFQRRAFVPIALPSEYYRRVEVTGDEILPYRSERSRTAIDAYDLERLRQGDVVEKAFFIADLERASKRLSEIEVRIAEIEREIEYADARFRCAYFDFRLDACEGCDLFGGKGRDFIEWEKKRIRLQQELDRLIAQQRRTRALLQADRVLTREGMLVVATDEIVKPHKDIERASDDLGEVLLVMRLGGRHMHWGNEFDENLVQDVPFGEHE